MRAWHTRHSISFLALYMPTLYTPTTGVLLCARCLCERPQSSSDLRRISLTPVALGPAAIRQLARALSVLPELHSLTVGLDPAPFTTFMPPVRARAAVRHCTVLQSHAGTSRACALALCANCAYGPACSLVPVALLPTCAQCRSCLTGSTGWRTRTRTSPTWRSSGGASWGWTRSECAGPRREGQGGSGQVGRRDEPPGSPRTAASSCLLAKERLAVLCTC